MADMMVIVSKAVFESVVDYNVGDLYETSEYNSKNKALSSVAQSGSLFLVTARPGDQLWLVGVLENPVFVGDRWTASANTVRITDLTECVPDLVFETGKGLTFTPGNLGFALQSPRKLTAADAAVLRKAAAASAPNKPAPAKTRRR